MNQLVTEGIILARLDYGEADRIITLLTPDHGKLRLMAKGVRRPKSKLAGGIELFSVSNITFIRGRGGIGTLVSTRLIKHYGNIVNQIERVQLGYELIKLLDKSVEDVVESEYFDILREVFGALDDLQFDGGLIRSWFVAQLLRLGGHTPNLETDSSDHPLEADKLYSFDLEAMTFYEHPDGQFDAKTIKLLRLLFGHYNVGIMKNVEGAEGLMGQLAPLLQSMQLARLRP